MNLNPIDVKNTNHSSFVHNVFNFGINLYSYCSLLFIDFLNPVSNEIILNIYDTILLKINTLSLCEQNGNEATGGFCLLQIIVVGF